MDGKLRGEVEDFFLQTLCGGEEIPLRFSEITFQDRVGGRLTLNKGALSYPANRAEVPDSQSERSGGGQAVREKIYRTFKLDRANVERF